MSALTPTQLAALAAMDGGKLAKSPGDMTSATARVLRSRGFIRVVDSYVSGTGRNAPHVTVYRRTGAGRLAVA
jgi:hypothetical protein